MRKSEVKKLKLVEIAMRLPLGEFSGNNSVLYFHPDYPYIIEELEKAGLIKCVYQHPKYPISRYIKVV